MIHGIFYLKNFCNFCLFTKLLIRILSYELCCTINNAFLGQEGRKLLSLYTAGCQQDDEAASPVQCAFNMSSSETAIHYTELDPLSAILRDCVCCPLAILELTKRDALKIFFACPKTKRRKTESTKPIFPIFSGQLHR